MEKLKSYSIKNLKKSFENLKVLDNITLEFPKSKVTAILGPSGCGKTTIFNILMGNIKDYEGTMEGFAHSNISCIFQEHSLIPWEDVYHNLTFVLEEKIPPKELDNYVNYYLGLVGLKEYKSYYPAALSGGMQQRVNIVRAFAYPSEILLMDEPFKSLDNTMKNDIYDLFKKLMVGNHKSIIFITHDIDEAIALGDNIVILSNKPTKVKEVLTKEQPDIKEKILSLL